MEKQVIIKPVVKSKFSGISALTKSWTTIEGAQLDRSGSYKTGLTSDEERKYEELLNVPKGTLNRKSEFWGTVLGLRLPNDKPYYFNIITPLDEVKLKVMEKHSDIAMNEMELATKPHARFYIEDKEAKAKIEEVALDYMFEATKLFMDTTSEEKKGYLKLYGKRGVEQLSDTIIKTELYKELTSNPKKFIDLINDPDVKIRVSIEEMIEQGLLKKRGNYYNYQDEVIGNSVDAVVAFFKDLKNQSLKIAIESEIKKKKK